MKVLFIGGTGIISTACVRLAIERDMDVSLLNRGKRMCPEGVRTIVADVNDLDSARVALGSDRWDVVVDFTVFTPSDVEKRHELLQGKTSQYIFISSASAYQKPVKHYLISESTPLENPYWDYSRNKAACEEQLFDVSRLGGLPTTIVRPSLTFGDTQAPLVMNSWQKPYTVIDRMRRGVRVIVPGDGTSLWTITHNTDFAQGLVGLFGKASAIGEAFHITSDEVLTWNQIYEITARAAGVEPSRILHIASDFIIACLPDLEGSLLGDKAVSAVFDNSKIKRFVPEFCAKTSFEEGIRRTIANFDSDENLRVIDEETNRKHDLLIEAYTAGLVSARIAFSK